MKREDIRIRDPFILPYEEKYYMFGTFFADRKMRATQALVADRPEGPYRVFGEPLTASRQCYSKPADN